MRFSQEGSLFLKKNIAFAYFALVQSPYKIEPEFKMMSSYGHVFLHFVNDKGERCIKQITNFPQEGIIVYHKICDMLGLEDEPGITRVMM